MSAYINPEAPLFQWANFEAAAPMLTGQERGLIERIHFVLVGTIRSDGTPPISPVEAHIVREHLMLVMIPDTLFQLFQEAIAHHAQAGPDREGVGQTPFVGRWLSN